MDNYIGRLLDDRYEILDMIGSGGMSVVYKARCNRLNRLVAIKILKDDLSHDAEFRRRFRAESQAVAMLSHPNVVSLYDVSHSDDLDYIVMELIEGITLKQYMDQKGQLNWREALHFALQIAHALEHAHSRGIIHRDIKPHNVVILKDGSVKVTDFGIARITSSQNTQTREALGSVHYISPEQAKGVRVDCRTDLYSLGVVMYEMLTGRPPYDGDTPVSVAIQHINARPTMPRELNPAIPEGLEQITMHAMEADLSKRYASAEEMILSMEAFRKNPNVLFDFEKSDASQHAHAPAQPAPTEREAPAQQPRPLRPAPQKSPVTEQPPASGKSGGKAAVIAGVVCIVLAVVGIIWFLYSYFFSELFSKTEEDTVPNFVGRYYEDIHEEHYPNFHLEVAKWQESDTVQSGYVIDQSPAADRTVKVGTTIELTVSVGSNTSQMPNLVNWSLQSAESYLDTLSLGLKVEIEYEPSDLYTDGYLVRTYPEEGAELEEGQQITLYVSQGPAVEIVPVPALVGEDVEQALLAIDDAGLGRGSLRYDDSELPEGTVIFQSVEAGEQVKEGTVINLRVSKGPIEAQEAVIKSISDDVEVETGDELVLSVKAKTDDDGVLSYAWYMSATGSVSDAEVVSRSAEDNTKYTVDTSQSGKYYYFCKIVNTLGTTSASVDSRMIEVIIKEPEKEIFSKAIHVTMPTDDDVYQVEVRVGGELQQEFEVDMTETDSQIINFMVSGSGVQDVDIYVEGILWETQTIDFDAEGGR